MIPQRKKSVWPQRGIILAGQSNAEGWRPASGVADASRAPGRNHTYVCASKYRWQGYNHTTSGNLGPEIGMWMKAGEDSPLCIAKYAVGGTKISTWLAGQANYNELMSTIKTAQDFGTNHWYGLAWIQYESDAQVQADADAYQANLTSFIASVRARLGRSDLKVAHVKVHPGYAGGTYNATISAAMTAYAAIDPLYEIVDCTDLALHTDNTHYTADATITMGQRLFTALRS